MTVLPDLRCVMKIRTCGPFWHKAAVSLSYPRDKAHQGLLTIDRPKAIGGALEIPLDRCDRMPTLVFASEKDQYRRQFSVCYGVWRRCVTLRVATDAIYRAWWAALETAYMSLHLKQITRTLATNCNEVELEETPKVDAVMNNFPLLEVSTPTSAVEINCRDGWQLGEDPDELVVVGSAGELKVDATPVVCPNDEHSISSQAVLGVAASYGYHSDRDGASSCIGSDVLDFLPGDLRDIMENYSSDSANSYSTTSSLTSSVRDHLPSGVLDLLDNCPIRTNQAQNNQSCGFDLFDGGHTRRRENLLYRGYHRESKSAKLSSGGSDASVGGSMAQTEDTTTVSAITSSTGRDALDDALSAIGAGRIDKARVEEIEEFASRRVSGSARAFKKTIVVERITKAWTDVARFAFRPDADYAQTTNRAKKTHSSTAHGYN
ncbi:hypothetical protein PHYSODRAFT_298594 [Phytophthora sojae]|uniref:PH domain-containing protein n=1 Tax=Phytophthora sojae (strain P6497) TaxID=1094619 RepID=G4Z911_PHYSP|nr:hypothetical protein PHYSODRAFT_298594 [Phytophthora sojae]EGZ20478.1 hypothetical protein PHYSODRAFT_298594 [Phytophthora sojae]|eukprot:XP_009523195.1 hypothetical protein PHYSODRAFT_298594 [Phytophthora sojae]